MPRGDQLARQWRLLQFLGRPEGVAVEDASRQLGCAVRTVWRDLCVLQDAGFPIYDERDGRRGLWKVQTAPPPDAEALRTHEEIPRPFVIAPPPASAERTRRGAPWSSTSRSSAAPASISRTLSSPSARWTASAVAGAASPSAASRPFTR